MKNYQVTIGYKAVICVEVKADSEEEAKEKGLELFTKKERDKWYKNRNVSLQDESFNAGGVLDIDSTWGMINN